MIYWSDLTELGAIWGRIELVGTTWAMEPSAQFVFKYKVDRYGLVLDFAIEHLDYSGRKAAH